MSAHTPGPWQSTNREVPIFVPLKAIYCERIGYQIGFVNTDRKSIEAEALANARLIAAAPENYACNVELAAIVRELCRHYGHPLPQATLDRSDAAIAKATGERA